MKNTGIELIAEERREQIEKHGYTLAHDEQTNCAKELAFVAAMLIEREFVEGIDDDLFPENWDRDALLHMLSKPYKQRLIIAAALLAAEIDHLQATEVEPSEKEQDRETAEQAAADYAMNGKHAVHIGRRAEYHAFLAGVEWLKKQEA